MLNKFDDTGVLREGALWFWLPGLMILWKDFSDLLIQIVQEKRPKAEGEEVDPLDGVCPGLSVYLR